MNQQLMKQTTTSDASDQPVQSNEQNSMGRPVPIEVKWNLPAWMMRSPGPRIEVEDDDIAFEEG